VLQELQLLVVYMHVARTDEQADRQIAELERMKVPGSNHKFRTHTHTMSVRHSVSESVGPEGN